MMLEVGAVSSPKRAAWLAALFALVALVLRCSTFGNPNLGVDEQFYLLVGQRMHEGALPYVDVWDRKPFGLFVLYWIFAFFPDPVLACQLGATMFAAATAWVIWRLLRDCTQPQGALLGGLAYLVLLGPFNGFGGQAPVFYNLFIATAAMLVWRERIAPLTNRGVSRIDVAMALCGLAIAIKPTAMFEGAFLGLWCALGLWRQGHRRAMIGPILRWMLLGAIPTLAIGAAYLTIGHGDEWWHAMVTSSLTKQVRPPEQLSFLSFALAMRIGPVVLLALWGLVAIRNERPLLIFLGGWLMAATVGLLVLLSFFAHYALPLLVPLSVAAGLAFARGGAGRIGFAALIAVYALWYDPTNFTLSRQARTEMAQLSQLAQAHDRGRGMLVFDGPSWLYAMTGERFLSPLVFPQHLNSEIERNVSHLETDHEVDRILAGRPGVVVTALSPRNEPVNRYATERVWSYIAANCHRVGAITLHERGDEAAIGVFGDCH
ncbi:hypothetical protein [Novosphingobium mathurense]|uniref:Dolichyl-phosphate-mannose-protein mannosyltransferase n=1 Tax=Novosphingobium mathurense TaxID=428990 RepID=A0A1U6IRD6_9SPHN|nr:hypothetical protein [Novosphingobium mathurense]SLK10548.1 hypothetical protein SAMN06295987_11212 [Novosphingobium mathurense]